MGSQHHSYQRTAFRPRSLGRCSVVFDGGRETKLLPKFQFVINMRRQFDTTGLPLAGGDRPSPRLEGVSAGNGTV